MKRLTVWFAILFLYPGVTAGAPILVGGTGSGSPQFSLVTVNIVPPTLTTRGPSNFNPGLDYTPDGATLYGLSSSLRIINPLNGSFSTVGPLTENGSSPILMASLTISPSGVMYAVTSASPMKLYTVDTSNGNLTLKGTFLSNNIVRGIEFAPDGTLYGAFAHLYKIDPTNASIVQDLGALGPSGTVVDDMDWGSDGILRGVNPLVAPAGPPYLSNLYAIDPNAAPGQLATLLSSYADVQLWSIASAPVPEPSTMLLAIVGLGGALAISWNRRRYRQG